MQAAADPSIRTVAADGPGPANTATENAADHEVLGDHTTTTNAADAQTAAADGLGQAAELGRAMRWGATVTNIPLTANTERLLLWYGICLGYTYATSPANHPMRKNWPRRHWHLPGRDMHLPAEPRAKGKAKGKAKAKPKAEGKAKAKAMPPARGKAQAKGKGKGKAKAAANPRATRHHAAAMRWEQ